jgi:beta-glucosidase
MTQETRSAATQDSPADVRAREVEQQITDDERFSLLVSVMGTNPVLPVRDERIPEGVSMSSGYVPGVPRLGVPAMLMSDASLSVTNPGYREGDTATALPADIALGASFNPALAREAGGMLGREARSRGFNVQLAGGINLAHDPRNGRNFEYLSESSDFSGASFYTLGRRCDGPMHNGEGPARRETRFHSCWHNRCM